MKNKVIQYAHEAYDINPHALYYDSSVNADVFVNMWYSSYKLFKSTYLFQNKDLLEALTNRKNNGEDIPIESLQGFIENDLLDNIKVSTCFENILKATLITREYLVHKISTEVYPILSEEQKRRPIHIDEVQKRIKKGIQTDDCQIKTKIVGLSKETIQYSWVLKGTGYKEVFKNLQKLFPILIERNDQRNRLHFLFRNKYFFTNTTYHKFEELNSWLNKNNKRVCEQFPIAQESPRFIVEDGQTGEQSIKEL